MGIINLRPVFRRVFSVSVRSFCVKTVFSVSKALMGDDAPPFASPLVGETMRLGLCGFCWIPFAKTPRTPPLSPEKPRSELVLRRNKPKALFKCQKKRMGVRPLSRPYGRVLGAWEAFSLLASESIHLRRVSPLTPSLLAASALVIRPSLTASERAG